MNNSSYREMLRNRVPKVVDYALKWCKAKERWIDHVYENFIGIYVHKDDRKASARTCLGIRKGKPKQFVFHDSIMWDQFGMDNQEKEYWLWVETWVEWFRKTYGLIENSYEISHKTGKYDKESFKNELRRTYLRGTSDKFVNYILGCLENK